MAKKALIDPRSTMIHPVNGHELHFVSYVEVADTFEAGELYWIDFPDSEENLTAYEWWDPTDSRYWKGPYRVVKEGELAVDAEGNPTEKWVFDWTNDVWTKQTI